MDANAPAPRRAKLKKWLRRAAIAAGAAFLLAALAPTALSILPLEGFASRKATEVAGVPVRIAGFSVGWWSPLRLAEFELSSPGAEPLLAVRGFRTENGLLKMALSKRRTGIVRIASFAARLERGADGQLRLPVFKPAAPAPPSPPAAPFAWQTLFPSIALPVAEIDAAIERIDLAFADAAAGEFSLRSGTASVRWRGGDTELVIAASGTADANGKALPIGATATLRDWIAGGTTDFRAASLTLETEAGADRGTPLRIDVREGRSIDGSFAIDAASIAAAAGALGFAFDASGTATGSFRAADQSGAIAVGFGMRTTAVRAAGWSAPDAVVEADATLSPDLVAIAGASLSATTCVAQVHAGYRPGRAEVHAHADAGQAFALIADSPLRDRIPASATGEFDAAAFIDLEGFRPAAFRADLSWSGGTLSLPHREPLGIAASSFLANASGSLAANGAIDATATASGPLFAFAASARPFGSSGIVADVALRLPLAVALRETRAAQPSFPPRDLEGEAFAIFRAATAHGIIRSSGIAGIDGLRADLHRPELHPVNAEPELRWDAEYGDGAWRADVVASALGSSAEATAADAGGGSRQVAWHAHAALEPLVALLAAPPSDVDIRGGLLADGCAIAEGEAVHASIALQPDAAFAARAANLELALGDFFASADASVRQDADAAVWIRLHDARGRLGTMAAGGISAEGVVRGAEIDADVRAVADADFAALAAFAQPLLRSKDIALDAGGRASLRAEAGITKGDTVDVALRRLLIDAALTSATLAANGHRADLGGARYALSAAARTAIPPAALPTMNLAATGAFDGGAADGIPFGTLAFAHSAATDPEGWRAALDSFLWTPAPFALSGIDIALPPIAAAVDVRGNAAGTQASLTRLGAWSDGLFAADLSARIDRAANTAEVSAAASIESLQRAQPIAARNGATLLPGAAGSAEATLSVRGPLLPEGAFPRNIAGYTASLGATWRDGAFALPSASASGIAGSAGADLEAGDLFVSAEARIGGVSGDSPLLALASGTSFSAQAGTDFASYIELRDATAAAPAVGVAASLRGYAEEIAPLLAGGPPKPEAIPFMLFGELAFDAPEAPPEILSGIAGSGKSIVRLRNVPGERVEMEIDQSLAVGEVAAPAATLSALSGEASGVRTYTYQRELKGRRGTGSATLTAGALDLSLAAISGGIRNASVRASMHDRRVNIDLLAEYFFGGPASLSVAVGLDSGMPAVSGDFAVTDFDTACLFPKLAAAPRESRAFSCFGSYRVALPRGGVGAMLNRSAFRMEITRLSSPTMREAMAMLDPEGSNPKIQATLMALRFGSPSAGIAELKGGLLNLAFTIATPAGMALPIPLFERVNAGEIVEAYGLGRFDGPLSAASLALAIFFAGSVPEIAALIAAQEPPLP